MKKELTTTELKKKLSNLDQKIVVQLICDLYKNSEYA